METNREIRLSNHRTHDLRSNRLDSAIRIAYDDRAEFENAKRSKGGGFGEEENLERKYRSKITERFAAGEYVSLFESFKNQAYKRLDILDAATRLDDLRNLRSNGFEKLKGDRQGQYSIRINMKWRISFEWSDERSKPFNIEIVDYHR